MHRRIDNDVILYFGFTISIWLCFGLTRLYIFFFLLLFVLCPLVAIIVMKDEPVTNA